MERRRPHVPDKTPPLSSGRRLSCTPPNFETDFVGRFVLLRKIIAPALFVVFSVGIFFFFFSDLDEEDLPIPSFKPIIPPIPDTISLNTLKSKADAKPPNYTAGCLYWYHIYKSKPKESSPDDILKYWTIAAHHGIGLGNLMIGHSYAIGQGNFLNYPRSAQHYKLAMKKGNRDGQFYYALALALGNGVALDQRQALKLIVDGKKKGHLLSTVWYAEIVLNRTKTEKKEKSEEGKNILEKASDDNCVEAKLILARRLITGNGMDHDMEKAFRLLKEAKESLNVEVSDHKEAFAAIGPLIHNAAEKENDNATKIRWLGLAEQLGYK
jgi:TPR repeat protein